MKRVLFLLVCMTVIYANFSEGYVYNLSKIEYNATRNIIEAVFEDNQEPWIIRHPYALICEIPCNNQAAWRDCCGNYCFDLYKLSPDKIKFTEYDEVDIEKVLLGHVEISQTVKDHVWRFRASHEGKSYMLNLWSSTPSPSLSGIKGNAGFLN